MALMRARHEVFGVADVPDNDYYRDNGWTEVDPSTPTRVEEERAAEARAFLGEVLYDPSAHTVVEVQEYLETASDEERERVLAAERDGKARSTLLDAE